MPTATLICRNCGKPYEGCRNARSVPGVFRWQDVACSPECGAEFLKAVLISRGEYVEPEEEQADKSVAVKTASAVESREETIAPAKKRTKRSVSSEE